MTDPITLCVDLSPAQAQAVAQFVKRIGWSEIRANSVTDAEAYLVRDAIEQLRRALASAGYAPR